MPTTCHGIRNRWQNSGHMDIDIVRAGAILICPVKVRGGGVYLGDMHALQGDGEIAGHTCDVAAALAAAELSAPDTETVARACGIDARKVEEFYQLFAETERVVTAFSQGVNQSSAALCSGANPTRQRFERPGANLPASA